MSDIKVGDLVMVIRTTPCCGRGIGLGRIFSVGDIKSDLWKCMLCGHLSSDATQLARVSGSTFVVQKSRLKKIDPPAEGDSLPTRADLEVTA